jgi:hypothetical protein
MVKKTADSYPKARTHHKYPSIGALLGGQNTILVMKSAAFLAKRPS